MNNTENVLEQFSKINFLKLPNGEEICYREVKNDNSNNTLLLVHGYMAGSFSWEPVIPKLSKNFRIIAIDFRGHGHSSYNTPINSLNDLADDIKLFLDELKITKIFMAGWSTGGGVTTSFVLRYPEYIHKFILLSSIPMKGHLTKKTGSETEYLKTKEDFQNDLIFQSMEKSLKEKNPDFFKIMYDQILFNNRPVPEEYVKRMMDETFLTKSYLDVGFYKSIFNVTDEDSAVGKGDGSIKNLRRECLIIHGDDDRVVTIEDSYFNHKIIGSLSTIQVFKNGSHCLFEYADELSNSITNFLLN